MDVSVTVNAIWEEHMENGQQVSSINTTNEQNKWTWSDAILSVTSPLTEGDSR
jgi:hypothetical protein